MKIETILNAMTLAYGNVLENFIDFDRPEFRKANRQYDAFRARILRIDSIGRSINADLNTEIEMLNVRITELDAKIDKLMGLAVVVDRLRKQRMNTDYMDAMDMAKEILK